MGFEKETYWKCQHFAETKFATTRQSFFHVFVKKRCSFAERRRLKFQNSFCCIIDLVCYGTFGCGNENDVRFFAGFISFMFLSFSSSF